MQSRKIIAARASIAASALLAATKLAVGLWSGSLALLSEAGHAFVDTGATVLTYFAIREAEKPADAEHHYGHGKVEALAALVETGFLFGLALLVIGEALRRLSETTVKIDAGWPVYGILTLSMLIDFLRSRQLGLIAKEEHSEALEADAIHFASDLISSTLVLIGIIATHYGFERGDELASVAVAGFIAVAGYRLGRRTINTLLDAAPHDLAPQIEKSVLQVPGVIAIQQLRLRSVGADIIGEIIVSVARSLRMEQAAQIKESVTAALASVEPRAQLTVVVEPVALDDETVIERTMLVSARRHLSVHNIIAQQVNDRLSIGVDIELEGAMPIGRAHAIATDFEKAIRDEFGADVEIETHIEPFSPHVLMGVDMTSTIRNAIVQALETYSKITQQIFDVHDVRVRETLGGWIVNYHCAVKPLLPVSEVHHALDDIERRMRDRFPEILHIVGHAEPEDHD